MSPGDLRRLPVRLATKLKPRYEAEEFVSQQYAKWIVAPFEEDALLEIGLRDSAEAKWVRKCLADRKGVV